ncbi:MAG: NAD(P)-binding domain-containing protein, partial [Myxococcota bacterium]|nr:NAD(P)-binding domain-containing protein [Myxococcota bacterium]
MSIQRVAVIGTGTMGRALSKGMIREGVVACDQVHGTVKHAREAQKVSGLVDFEVGTDNCEAARGAEIILLCTKPKQVASVVAELSEGGALSHGPLIVSIAAGVSTRDLEQAAAEPVRVIRAMPNTPCLIGEGMVVLSPGSQASDEDMDVAETLFRPLARVARLDEEHM